MEIMGDNLRLLEAPISVENDVSSETKNVGFSSVPLGQNTNSAEENSSINVTLSQALSHKGQSQYGLEGKLHDGPDSQSQAVQLVEAQSPSVQSQAVADSDENSFLASIGLQPRDMLSSPETLSRQKAMKAQWLSSVPAGWRKEAIQRKAGMSVGKYDIYYYSPDGRRHRSKNEIVAYLAMKNITNIDVDLFDFTGPDTTFMSSKPRHLYLSGRSKRPRNRSSGEEGSRKRMRMTLSRESEGVGEGDGVKEGGQGGESSPPVSNSPQLPQLTKISSPERALKLMKQSKRSSFNGRGRVGGGGRVGAGYKPLSVKMNFKSLNRLSKKTGIVDDVETDELLLQPLNKNNNHFKSKDIERLQNSHYAAVKQQRFPVAPENSSGGKKLARVHRNTELMNRPVSSSMSKQDKRINSRAGMKTPMVGVGGVDSVGVGGRESVGEDWRLAVRSDWRPPQSPYFLLEETLYSDPWKVLVASLFVDNRSELMPKRSVMAFFKVCPTAAIMKAKTIARLVELLHYYEIDKQLLVKLKRFTLDYMKDGWTKPSDLYGVEEHGVDAYVLFCTDQWKLVAPRNPRLNKYHRWLWDNKKALGL